MANEPPARPAALDRLLLLATSGLAAYQIVIGLDGLAAVPTLAYTLAFGILLVACLLVLFLGWPVLDSTAVVVVSTGIPLGLSLGMVWESASAWRILYLAFALMGVGAIAVMRALPLPAKMRAAGVATVHGVAGWIIVLLPILRVAAGQRAPAFALVSVGGALMGLGGLLLSFLRADRPLLPQPALRKALPSLLLLMAAAFAAGFASA